MPKARKTPETGHELRETGSRDDTDLEIEPLQLKTGDRHQQPKYHKHAMYLLIAYVPLLIVPWVLTCIISRRPLGFSTYYNQRGFYVSDIERMEKWMTAINVFNSISSLVTIPILSALIAQAAAVYTQKHEARHDLRLHLAALADRGWTDPFIMSKSWRWNGLASTGTRNLLHFAAIIILLGSIQQPLYQILAPTESLLIPTCGDTTYGDPIFGGVPQRCIGKSIAPKLVGWDLEPSEMTMANHEDILQKLIRDLASVSLNDVKPHLWANISNPDAEKQNLGSLTSESFTAALEQGTGTGVLREHIMRLNSSVQCERIQRSEFPSVCSGERPFRRTFSHGNESTRICVPGRIGYSPWTLLRNRQDITEELFLDVFEELKLGSGREFGNFTSDYTLHCTADTTRGYFELGNYRNNNTWGPILNAWPAPEDMESEYNDMLGYKYPTESDFHKPRIQMDAWPSSWQPSGPLTMAAIALFGNKTFFDLGTSAWNDTVDSGSLSFNTLCGLVPFALLSPHAKNPLSDSEKVSNFPYCSISSRDYEDPRTLREHLSIWLHGFNDTAQATTALSTTVYLASEALLTMDKWLPNYGPGGSWRTSHGGRLIFAGSGTTIQKPKLSVATIVIVTIILVLELLGLAILAWLIYRGPSETRNIDAMTFSRLKDSMEE